MPLPAHFETNQLDKRNPTPALDPPPNLNDTEQLASHPIKG